jgi:uncharacterized protein (TIGR03437 family)
MRLRLPVACCLLFISTLLSAETTPPAITSIVNAASFTPQLSPGCLAAIFGTNLASATATAATQPLPTTLGDVTVMVNSVAAPLQYVSPAQINFVLPAATGLGPATVSVTVAGSTSPKTNIAVALTAPGIFATSGAALALNPDGSSNSGKNPVAPGAGIRLYLTGADPAVNAPSLNYLPVNATVGNIPATVQSLAATGTVGVSLAAVQVPSPLPDGLYPVIITVAGVASNAVTITVGKASGPAGPLTSLGAIAIPGPWASVQLYGNVALLCGSPGIQPVNLQTPSAPAIPDGYAAVSTGGFICSVESNNLLQLSGANGNTLNVYSLADPTKPASLGSSVTLPGLFANSMVPAGNTVYFSTDWYSVYGTTIIGQYGDFFSYDLTAPKSPVLRSQLFPDPLVPGSSNLSPRWNVALADAATAIVTSTTATGPNTGNGTGLLQIVDVSTPPVFKVITTLEIPTTAVATGIAIQNGIALIVGNTAGWSNPTSGGRSALFGGNLTIAAVDVTSPRSPKLRSTLIPSPALPSSGTYSVVGVGNGRFAIAVGGPPPPVPPVSTTTIIAPVAPISGTIGIVDASNPASLIFTPVMTVLAPGDLTFSNGLILAPGANGLNVLQVNEDF